MQLKHTPILIFGSVLLASCATVLNKKNYEFDIHYGQQNTRIRYKDSVYSQPFFLKVRRSKQPLVFTAFNDSIVRRYEIRPNLNPMFVWGNLGWIALYPLVPVAYGIDLTNPKRFHYGDHLMVRLDDTSAVTVRPAISGNFHRKAPVSEGLRRYFRTQYTHQGDTYLSVSSPFTLQSSSFPGVGRANSAGPLGISIGAEHYYKDRRSYGISAGASISSPDGVEDMFFEKFGSHTRKRLSSVFADLYHRHTINRFSFAYGINYTLAHWQYYIFDYDVQPTYYASHIVTSHNFGVMLSGYFHIKPFFLAGIVYRPTFLRVSPDTKGIYQHTLSFDMAFRLNVTKK